MELYKVLRRPLITEKGTMLQDQTKFMFEVAVEANKNEIKEAVEVTFGVNVVDVNTMHVKGHERRISMRRYKMGASRDWKKAIVTLQSGQSIKYFDQQ
jgi:large subunit ribosomal protein L23